MVCQYCGNKVHNDDYRFCYTCGRRLNPVEEHNHNKTGMFCLCGNTVEIDYLFCRGCGRQLQSGEAKDLLRDETHGFCPYCGNECTENDTFCRVCGTPIDCEWSKNKLDRGEKPERSENNEDGIKLAESYFNALTLTSKRIIDEEYRQKVEQKPYLKDVVEFINFLTADEYYMKANQTLQLFEDLKVYLPKLFSGSEYYVFFPEAEDFPETKKHFSHKPEIDFTSLLKEREKAEAKGFAKEIYRILWDKRSKNSTEIIPYFISSKENSINDILILPITKKNAGSIFGIIILTKKEVGFEDKYLEIADELPSLLRSKIRWGFYNKDLI